MWSQLFAGGIVSFINFGIHALVTGIVIEATRHTAKPPVVSSRQR